eukprot:5380449-Prymnesium_polylepis.1
MLRAAAPRLEYSCSTPHCTQGGRAPPPTQKLSGTPTNKIHARKPHLNQTHNTHYGSRIFTATLVSRVSIWHLDLQLSLQATP